MTRILSVFNLLKRVGFAVLLLGGLLYAQPYEPTYLLDVTGEVGQYLGFSCFQSVGDQNGDGFDDVIVGSESSVNSLDIRLYWGNNLGNASFIDFGRYDTTNDRYGWSDGAFDAGFTVPAGDVNGDGHQDILLSLYLQSAGAGWRSALFLGGPGVFDTIPDWIGALSDLHYLTNVGDYNGDGRDDYTKRPLNEGMFNFYLGEIPGSDDALWSHFDFNSSHMGFGDVNGDGYSDFGRVILLGDSGYVRAELYLGSPLADSLPALIRVRPSAAGNTFEYYHRIVGDINGDGYDDIISRATSFAEGARKYIYWGGPDMDLVDDVELHWPNNNVPKYVTPLGDINGDGYDDVAHYEHYLTPPNDHIEVWLGGDPLPESPAWVLDGPLDGMNYPYRIGEAGDFNGDGIDDWFFSAYHGLEERGRIIVVAGDRNFGLAARERTPLPRDLSLSVFPNPFNSTLRISFDVPLHADVNVVLYDLLGREVDVIYRGRVAGSAISYTAPAGLASGIYFARASAGDRVALRKVVLLK